MSDEKFRRPLCAVLGLPELATNERFAGFAGRDRNREELLAELDAAFGESPLTSGPA